MRKIFLTLFTMCMAAFTAANAQQAGVRAVPEGVDIASKKPILMVIPSMNLCNAKGCVNQIDINGRTVNNPDYNKVLLDNDLSLAISKLGEIMTDLGFDLKTLSATLSMADTQAALDATRESKESGSFIEKTDYERLMEDAKPDISMEVFWETKPFGMSKKVITFNIQGIDSYTGKQIAASSGTSMPMAATSDAELLFAAVQTHMRGFSDQLKAHFAKYFEQGREITIRFDKFASSPIDYETEFDGDPLGLLIEDFLADNTVGGRFSVSNTSANSMVVEQVAIPMITMRRDRPRAMDARLFGNNLVNYIKQLTGVDCKITTKGLGSIHITLGEK